MATYHNEKLFGTRDIKTECRDYTNPKAMDAVVAQKTWDIFSFGRILHFIVNKAYVDSRELAELQERCCNNNLEKRPDFKEIMTFLKALS